MDWFSNLAKIDIEVTNHCNASCPGCIRNEFGGKKVDSLNLAHMSETTWDNILYSIKDKKIREIEFNGNVGDFIMHPNIIDMLDKFCQQHPGSIVSAQTNGAARNVKFWQDLAKVLKNNVSNIGFAVDGVTDEMNHIHRRNAKFSFAMRNAQAFIEAGADAYWVYTLFEHNMSYQDQALKIATDKKFSRITFRNSCIPSEDLIVKTPKENYQIGTLKDSLVHERHVALNDKKSDFDNSLLVNETTDYKDNKCQAYHKRKINIDWRGNVYACSYMYAPNTLIDDGNIYIETKQVGGEKNWHTLDVCDFNINNHTLKDILTNDWFKKLENEIYNNTYQTCYYRCVQNRLEEIE